MARLSVLPRCCRATMPRCFAPARLWSPRGSTPTVMLRGLVFWRGLVADPKGFLKVTERELPKRRPVPVRIMDWKEVYELGDSAQLRRQAGRCMDCGIPFCHQGSPLGNLIPEWNDLISRRAGRAAAE